MLDSQVRLFAERPALGSLHTLLQSHAADLSSSVRVMVAMQVARLLPTAS